MSRLVKQSLLAGSVIMIGMNLFTRLFGYAREALIADRFGTSATFDTFLLAFTFPEILSFVIGAAVPSALLPLRARLTKEGDRTEGALFWNGLLAYAGLLMLLSMGLYFGRRDILTWFAPTLPLAQLNTGLGLAGLLAWFLFFRGLEAYFKGWLFARRHFVIPALSGIIFNAVVLTAIITLYGRFDIFALAYGWLASSILTCALHAVFVLKVVRPGLGSSGPERAAHIGMLMRATLIIGMIEAIALVYPIVDRFFAARYLGEGQISALRYAVFLIHIPSGIFVVTLGLTSFPWIADLSHSEQREKLAAMYRQSIRLVVYVMVLVAIGALMFAPELVRVAFMRGSFDAVSLDLTASPLQFYALGIVFYSIYTFQMRFYYARSLLLRLMTILGIMLLVKLILSAQLVKPMEQDGLALATAVTWVICAIVMTIDMARQIGEGVRTVFLQPAPRLLACALGTAGFWLAIRAYFPVSPDWSLTETAAWLVPVLLAGCLVYFLLGIVVRLPEPHRVWERVRMQFGSRKSA